MRAWLVVAALAAWGATAAARQGYPVPVDAEYVARNFHFANGEVLPEVRLHYVTVGAVRKKKMARRVEPAGP